MKISLTKARTAGKPQVLRISKSDGLRVAKDEGAQESRKAKRSDMRNGLTRRQRIFVLEKLVGLNDKDAALAAGYSVSVAENTKQRIWKPRVRAEWERLQRECLSRMLTETQGSENLSEPAVGGR